MDSKTIDDMTEEEIAERMRSPEFNKRCRDLNARLNARGERRHARIAELGFVLKGLNRCH